MFLSIIAIENLQNQEGFVSIPFDFKLKKNGCSLRIVCISDFVFFVHLELNVDITNFKNEKRVFDAMVDHTLI